MKTIVNRIAMYFEKCKSYRLTSQIRICLNLVMINTLEKQTNKLKYYIFVSSEAFGTHDRHAGSISW